MSRWSKGLSAGTSIGSNAFSGFRFGSAVGGPLGGVLGGILGGAKGVYDKWDDIRGFFGSPQKEKEDVGEGSNSSLTGGGAVPLTGSELDDARQKDAMSFYAGLRSTNPPRRVTSSMLLAGGYGR